MKHPFKNEPKNLNRLEQHPDIKGYDFAQPFDLQAFLDAYKVTGMQATNLSVAKDIINDMLHDNAHIMLSFTSNLISSGLRDIITYLVRHKKIQAIVTSAGGVEEDLIKCFGPFKLGVFDIPGRMLYDEGISRIGNIFVPDDRYAYFDVFMTPAFEKLHTRQNELGRALSPSEIIKELGLAINNTSSYLYWAAKNDIPVYCPGLMDGTIGDLMYYFLHSHPGMQVDVMRDHKLIIDTTLQQEKTGAILLGGGTPKHYVLNANIFRGGADYAVYVTTATEHDGSDSGGNQEEAKSWAKIKCEAQAVKVVGDATIIFPLLVAGTFAQSL